MEFKKASSNSILILHSITFFNLLKPFLTFLFSLFLTLSQSPLYLFNLHSTKESDPEPEVDLTNLIARVSSLAANDTLSLSNRPSDQEERRNLEDDIDRSLAYLHSKERDRRNPNSRKDEDRSEKLVREREIGGEETEEERERMRLERESMRKDKEKAEALRGELEMKVTSL